MRLDEEQWERLNARLARMWADAELTAAMMADDESLVEEALASESRPEGSGVKRKR